MQRYLSNNTRQTRWLLYAVLVIQSQEHPDLRRCSRFTSVVFFVLVTMGLTSANVALEGAHLILALIAKASY